MFAFLDGSSSWISEPSDNKISNKEVVVCNIVEDIALC